GVTDRGADEAETALLQILAHGVGFWSAGMYRLGSSPVIYFRPAFGEMPDVFIEAAEFLLDCQVSVRVGNGGGDFESVANDPGIFQQRADFLCVIPRDLFRVEAIKGAAIVFPLIENRFPAQAGLRAFENQEFEESAVVVNGHTPFLVV